MLRFLLFFLLIVNLSYAQTYELSTASNTGIGTASPNSTLGVGGNLSVGNATYTQTIPPTNGALIQGNVGIGSLAPGQALDVQGTVRSTGVNVTGLTSSQITATDANQNLQSLTTATYPSLTELSYVKGVTSALQTQINGKQANLSLVAGTYTDGDWCSYASSGTLLNCNNAAPAPATSGSASLQGNGSGGFTNVSVGASAVVGLNSSNQLIAATAGTNYAAATSGSTVLQGNGSGGFTNVSLGAENVIGLNSSNQLVAGSGYISTLSPITLASPNVGIGSTVPGQVLDVQGTVRASHIVDNDFGTTNLSPSGNTTTVATANGTLTNGHCVQIDSNKNFVDAGGACTTGGGGGTVNSGTIGQYAYYASSTNAVSNQNPLSTDTVNVGIGTTGPSSLLDVNRKFNVFSGGNVGIGSIVPGQILDVQGTTRSTQFIDTGVTASTVLVVNSSKQITSAANLTDTAYSTAVGANPTGTIGLSAVNGSSANFMRADGAPALGVTISPTWTGNHTFAPSSGNTVFTAGNVGIGSATPGQILDVQGTVRALEYTGLSNVGIGSYNPGMFMDVAGSIRVTGFVITVGAGSGKVLTSDGGGGGTWQTAGSGSGTVNSGTTGQVGYYASSTTAISGSSAMFISGNASGNNVGIGSATPGQLLDVQGTTRILGGGDLIVKAGNVGIGTNFVSSTGENALTVMNGNVGIGTWIGPAGLTVNTSGNSYFGGNVGIGTKIPSSSLEVEGGNVGIGSSNAGDILDVQGTVRVNGYLAGGTTGNVGIGTAVANSATCDSVCNTASKRCLIGMTVPLTGFEPCSASISGDCLCLSAS